MKRCALCNGYCRMNQDENQFHESLIRETPSRRVVMQHAREKIDELLMGLSGAFHILRQSGIDEELFDVVSGFEALSVEEQ